MNKYFLINMVMLFFVIFFILNINKKYLNNNNFNEGFSDYNLIDAMGKLPTSEIDVLVQDYYPSKGKNQISNNTPSKMWWHYPSFKLGSYDQITNNLKYSNNPDLGSCMPGNMCGALYHEKKNPSNYITPLPQINPNCGNRVGYFTTQHNMLPFRSHLQNILY